ncbi:MAG: M48 family metallopeptidase [bacterium]
MLETDERNIETVKSNRATRPRIDVDIRGVKVIIPEGSGLDPEELIEEKRDWIEEKLEQFEKHREKIPERRFEEGAEWPYLGENHLIELDDSLNGRMGERRNGGEDFGRIVLNRNKTEKNSIREELEHFYREHAREYITELVEKWSDKLNVTYDKLYIRNQRTKWASCSGKSNLSFNFRLMMAPPEIIEYIVIHELCHLKHPNHGAKFDRLLARKCKNYREHEQWLDENSVKLIFTEEDL